MKKLMVVVSVLVVMLVAGCDSDADVVSENLSKDADQFKVRRRIVFINAVTGDYLFKVEGNCSTTRENGQLYVICKLGEDKYQRHYFGITELTPYTVEQLDWLESDPYKYEIVFKPESIIPITIDVE